MNGTAPAIDTSLRPLVALRALSALFRDPQDTRQIFIIFRALRGRSGLKLFERFAATEAGGRVLAEKRDLLPRLEDRAALAALPDGSVGRAYLAFMEEEQLSAQGLVTMSAQAEPEIVPPDMERFRNRMRDAHDLTHILTGYGRDPLGELCLMAFMNRHSRQLGQLLIVLMSLKRVPRAGRAAIWQGWRQGRMARWFPGLDFEALLPRPLDEVRRELKVPAPTRYQALMP